MITMLTGITESMVMPAPPIEAVLPTLVEFIGDAVLVGHNLRFDTSFLDAALVRTERPRLANRRVDTAALARRLVRDEVPNCKLGTLADRFRLAHQPSHRALDDALATGDLLHVLLERAAAFGVFGLDDLLALPKIASHAQAGKLGLTADLPRRPGVYRFLDAAGTVLYVGKASDLRSRVRSYFSSDSRRKVGSLLREFATIDIDVCAHALEAGAREVRQIQQHLPRYNRRSKTISKYRFLKLTDEAFPRFSVVRDVRDDGATYLGPLSSQRTALRVAEAIETVVPLRRCTKDPTKTRRDAPCAAAQLGVSTCPCSGAITPDAYAPIAATARRIMEGDAATVLDQIESRMVDLAAAERFEEAADLRDRAAALAEALRRQARIRSLRVAGRLVLTFDGGGAELERGVLVNAWGADGAIALDLDASPATDIPDDPNTPLPRHLVDEILANAAWLDRSAPRVRIESSELGLALPAARPGRFRPPG
jgi:DNA polymerase-3 subunit epsilon